MASGTASGVEWHRNPGNRPLPRLDRPERISLIRGHFRWVRRRGAARGVNGIAPSRGASGSLIRGVLVVGTLPDGRSSASRDPAGHGLNERAVSSTGGCQGPQWQRWRAARACCCPGRRRRGRGIRRRRLACSPSDSGSTLVAGRRSPRAAASALFGGRGPACACAASGGGVAAAALAAWRERGDIDSLAIAPTGVGFVVETKTRTYDHRHLARVHEQAAWLSRRRRRWCRPARCRWSVVRARGVQRLEQNVSSSRSIG